MYNPRFDIVDSFKKAGKTGIGYLAAMVVGSTVTENLFPRLPHMLKVVLRALTGTGVGYISGMMGHDGEDIVVGSLLYGMSEIGRSFLYGRKLPLFLKSGLEDVASALPVPSAGTTGSYLFNKQNRPTMGAYVPDSPTPLHNTRISSRVTSRFNY